MSIITTPLHIQQVKDIQEAKAIFEKAKDIFKEDQSLVLYRKADFEHIEKLIKTILEDNKVTSYRLYKVTAPEKDDSIVGAFLLYFGFAWYNPDLFVGEEICTVRFGYGYGISRCVANFLKQLVETKKIDVAVAGASNPYCAETIRDSYSAEGFMMHPSFYLMREDIEEYLDTLKDKQPQDED